jgi:hypothetical protein
MLKNVEEDFEEDGTNNFFLRICFLDIAIEMFGISWYFFDRFIVL